MAEATLDPKQAAALADAARLIDRTRMKQIGSFHFAMAMGALTLWGAAVAWAQTTGWALAEFAAVANAFVAALVLVPIVHEWGHGHEQLAQWGRLIQRGLEQLGCE